MNAEAEREGCHDQIWSSEGAKKIDSNESSEQKCRIKTKIKNIVITLRKMFGYPLSTLSNSSKPNVRVISLMPCNQYGCSPFVSWHKS